jgi:hypothetical protein
MTPDLSKDLQKVIETYLDGHRSRSIATLSRVSGVAYSTLRRFAQTEGNPTAEPVFKILDATLPTTEKIAFLKVHFPAIAHSIEKSVGPAHESGKANSEEFATFYRRSPHNFILNLSITSSGTTVETIQRLCGERGLTALDEMVESEILSRDLRTGDVRFNQSSIVITDPDLTLNQIRLALDYFDRSTMGTEAARIGYASQSLNHAGLTKVHGILTEALRQVYELNDDPKYQGQIPCFLGALFNVYDKKPFLETRE